MDQTKQQSGDWTRALQDNIGAQMIDKSLQSYFKEALRPVEVKVFSIEFTF